jgi:hypothetical protein
VIVAADIALHPGNQITPRGTPELARAARVTNTSSPLPPSRRGSDPGLTP